MNLLRRLSAVVVLVSTLFTFNAYAMNNEANYDMKRPTPQNEEKNEDNAWNYKWIWLSDETCVRFKTGENQKVDNIELQYNLGILVTWREKENGNWKKQNRKSFSGKWSQSAEGIRSFEFDDKTIPVGVTKIDGVLYAFNGYGELKAGYEYYTGIKTEADGLVKADSAEFTQWLATQYLPECTSHE
jgi:hypothetical protein